MATDKPAAAPADAVPVEAPREVDRVAMVSLRADGTPDQTEGFEVIADPAADNV